MSFSDYDVDTADLLSTVQSEAMQCVRKWAGGRLNETLSLQLSERIATNLKRAYDLGERGPSVLKRAGLRDILVRAHKTETAACASVE